MKLWRLNSYFELELRKKKLFPREYFQKNSSLEKLFLFLSESSSDITYLSEDISEEFGIYLRRLGFSPNYTTGQALNSKLKLEEWGKVARLEQGALTLDEHRWNGSRLWNSKVEQARFRIRNEVDPNFSQWVVESEEDWSELINSENKGNSFVWKFPLGLAGIHHTIFNADEKPKAPGEFPVLVEKWVSRCEDFSTLWEQDPEEGFSFLCQTKAMITENGQFQGCEILVRPDDKILRESEACTQKIFRDFSPGYKGPVALDGFFYRDERGKKELRLLSEANFRYSMGRICWEIGQRFLPNFTHNYLIILPALKHKDVYSHSLALSKGNEQWMILTPSENSNGKSFSRIVCVIGSRRSMPVSQILDTWMKN